MSASAVPRRLWTADEVRALGVRTTVPVAGSILAGLCGRESYKLYERDAFPVPVLKVGRRLVVPVQPILELLGLAEDGGSGISQQSEDVQRSSQENSQGLRRLRAVSGGDHAAT